MPIGPHSNIQTKDGYELEDMLDLTRELVNAFNETERPFRDMFVTEVSEQTFFQDRPNTDLYWDKIAEGEHPRTVVDEDEEGKWITIQGDTYAKGLGITRERFERSTSDRLMDLVENMLEGAANTQDRLVRAVFMENIADGRELWYDVPDYGQHNHSNTHDHVFTSTSELFGDSNAYEPHKHVEAAKDHLTHHNYDGPFVAMVSTDFKRKMRDEFTYNAQYHIPMATDMRSGDVRDLDIVVDNVRMVQDPWISGNTVYVTQVDNDGPVKYWEDQPVDVTRPNGAQVESPGDLLGARGYGRWGARHVDPLRTVKFTADNIA